jgi:hypothetical protein
MFGYQPPLGGTLTAVRKAECGTDSAVEGLGRSHGESAVPAPAHLGNSHAAQLPVFTFTEPAIRYRTRLGGLLKHYERLAASFPAYRAAWAMHLHPAVVQSSRPCGLGHTGGCCSS